MDILPDIMRTVEARPTPNTLAPPRINIEELLPLLEALLRSQRTLEPIHTHLSFTCSQSKFLTSAKLCSIIPATKVRLLRSRSGKLPFYPQKIIDSVQNCVLPLDVIPEPKDLLSRASIKYSERCDWRFLARNDGQPFLQLWPRLSEELCRLLPCEPARGDDEPFRLVRRGWNLEREDVCPRHVPHVDVHRRTANGIVLADGTTRWAGDEPVDEPVRARCGRIVDLA